MDITSDTPLRLKRAAELAFPGGGMTASGLRRESRRNRLVIERIAGKDYTTLAHIERMRHLCRVEAREPTSCSVGNDETAAPISRTKPSGLSETDPTKRALAAAMQIVEGLSATSKDTSTENTLRASPQDRATLIPFRSQTP